MKKICSVLFLALALCMTACHAPEKVVYLQDVESGKTIAPTAASDITVRPGDKISILVSSRSPELANLFNLAVPYRYVGTTGTSMSQSQTALYTVDPKGEIDFPILGKILVAGKSRLEISTNIKEKLISEDLLKDAVVSVDFGNLTFSVLGEVASPGRYSFDKDRITLLEAITMARDLTIHGRRDNVLLVRTNVDGSKETFRVDLRDSKSLFDSPAYYVQQNDVIYVTPTEVRARQSTVNGNNVLSTSFWISLTSLACTVILMVNNLK